MRVSLPSRRVASRYCPDFLSSVPSRVSRGRCFNFAELQTSRFRDRAQRGERQIDRGISFTEADSGEWQKNQARIRFFFCHESFWFFPGRPRLRLNTTLLKQMFLVPIFQLFAWWRSPHVGGYNSQGRRMVRNWFVLRSIWQSDSEAGVLGQTLKNPPNM